MYALLAAFLSELVMNWSEIVFRWLYLALFVLIVGLELVVVSTFPQPNIAYGSHFAGGVYGFALGLCMVRNWRWKRHEYIVLFASASFVLVATVILLCSIPQILVED